MAASVCLNLSGTQRIVCEDKSSTLSSKHSGSVTLIPGVGRGPFSLNAVQVVGVPSAGVGIGRVELAGTVSPCMTCLTGACIRHLRQKRSLYFRIAPQPVVEQMPLPMFASRTRDDGVMTSPACALHAWTSMNLASSVKVRSHMKHWKGIPEVFPVTAATLCGPPGVFGRPDVGDISSSTDASGRSCSF